MPDGALIHLRVPAETKARWVRESRAEGKRLTDWIIEKVEANMKTHGEIFAVLLTIKRTHPDTAGSIEEVMEFITEAMSIATGAADELEYATRPNRDYSDRERLSMRSNAEAYRDRLDKIRLPDVSHGGDI